MFNWDENALAALLMGAGTPRGNPETPGGLTQANLLGAFELLRGASNLGGGNPTQAAVTPPDVQGGAVNQDQGALAQGSQNWQEGAALPTATNANNTPTTPNQPTFVVPQPTAPIRETGEIKGVLHAIDKVTNRSTAQRLKNEFKWQWTSGTNNTKKFKEEALTPGQGIKIYGFVQEDSPVIQFIHGLGRFFDSEAPPEVQGKPIAFLGDRTRFGEPRPIIPPAESTWNWKTVTVNEDAAAWATHQSLDENEGKLWASAGGLAAEVSMPRLVYLPSVVAKFVATKPRTAWEVHQFLDEKVQQDESDIVAEDVVDLKSWLLTVGQTAGAKGLALKMDPVVTTASVFEEWAFGHVNSYLGEKGAAVQQQEQPTPTANQGNAMLEGLVRMLFQQQANNNMANNNMANNTSISNEKNGEEKVKPYSQYDEAKLMGYCNEWDPSQLPQIWKMFKTTKETEDHRMNLERAIKEWSQAQGIEVDRSIFFSKETVDDIVKHTHLPSYSVSLVEFSFSFSSRILLVACWAEAYEPWSSTRYLSSCEFLFKIN
jgi:hypothetical protein